MKAILSAAETTLEQLLLGLIMENIMAFIDFKFDFAVLLVKQVQSALHPGVPVVLDGVVRSSLQHLGHVRPAAALHAVVQVQQPLLLLGPGGLVDLRVQVVVPSRITAAKRFKSNYNPNLDFLRNYLSRHCLPIRSFSFEAIWVHFLGPYCSTSLSTRESSCLVQGPAIKEQKSTLLGAAAGVLEARLAEGEEALLVGLPLRGRGLLEERLLAGEALVGLPGSGGALHADGGAERVFFLGSLGSKLLGGEEKSH